MWSQQLLTNPNTRAKLPFTSDEAVPGLIASYLSSISTGRELPHINVCIDFAICDISNISKYNVGWRWRSLVC